ncbi:unnamed protein product (macronuclear) [Paramecium tetraurelia]|uniref:Trimethylguanosine synthase n=1 Tax=Paramecium tetraurelia TaxID=5888 RepID=A0DBP0_PARTE|nr:uncharacterized protein GSPATT00015354001 [Paramecium tetraurelia]CAK80457.1 unnamed protein product [Paramecium tetraurelia]|eukprot:XP_001447854.1 hypothetical protein (macronuclear) [Paramecium tetraurelia strain d4-2]
MIETQKLVHRKLSVSGYPQNEFFVLESLKLKITKKNFPCQLHPGISIDIPKQIQKFYRKRFFLFKKFNEGIQLDEESWYSVIPEEMSIHIANKLKASSPDSDVIDGFCGSGGLAIQLAKCFKTVICIDIDPMQNTIFINSARSITLPIICKCMNPQQPQSQMNFLEYTHTNQDFILIMCPPWGGLNYSHQPYDLNSMKPSLQDLLTKGLQMTTKIVLQLPKNIDIQQLGSIFKDVTDKLRLELKPIEVEMMLINEQINQLIIYYGL